MNFKILGILLITISSGLAMVHQPDGRLLKVLKPAGFDDRDNYYRNYGSYGSYGQNNYYYPTTQASLFSFLNPATTPSPYYGPQGYGNNYNSRYYQNGYDQDDYLNYRYGYTTSPPFPFNLFPTTTRVWTTTTPPPFPFNLFPTTTTTTPAPFPLNLFQAPATEPPPPFPLNILFPPTTPKPFFGLGK